MNRTKLFPRKERNRKVGCCQRGELSNGSERSNLRVGLSEVSRKDFVFGLLIWASRTVVICDSSRSIALRGNGVYKNLIVSNDKNNRFVDKIRVLSHTKNRRRGIRGLAMWIVCGIGDVRGLTGRRWKLIAIVLRMRFAMQVFYPMIVSVTYNSPQN